MLCPLFTPQPQAFNRSLQEARLTPFSTIEPQAAPPHCTATYRIPRSKEIFRVRNIAKVTAGLTWPPGEPEKVVDIQRQVIIPAVAMAMGNPGCATEHIMSSQGASKANIHSLVSFINPAFRMLGLSLPDIPLHLLIANPNSTSDALLLVSNRENGVNFDAIGIKN